MQPLRPDTLSEALDILARPVLVQVTAGGPPPRPAPHALLMDTGRISEMAGIHRLGREMVVGVNNSWAGMLRSSLLRPGAACLVDAAELMEEDVPGGALLHALDAAQPDTPLLLALTALDARIELALREAPGRTVRQTLPLQRALKSPPEGPHLPLTVRFSVPFLAAGSALYREKDLSPMQPDAHAAAALVTLDPDSGQIASFRLALALPGRWPVLCPAIEGIVGQEPGREVIEAAVQWARQDCQPTATDPDFSLALSSHLMRVTLDRALARARAI